MRYQPYDQMAVCRKCGWPDVSTEYENELIPQIFGREDIDRPERLRRQCKRCGCLWWEEPLDYTEEAYQAYLYRKAERNDRHGPWLRENGEWVSAKPRRP